MWTAKSILLEHICPHTLHFHGLELECIPTWIEYKEYSLNTILQYLHLKDSLFAMSKASIICDMVELTWWNRLLKEDSDDEISGCCWLVSSASFSDGCCWLGSIFKSLNSDSAEDLYI